MKHILFLLLPLMILASSDFITPMEYASQLYENPRGIGCQKCHGANGEGKVIANYIHKGKKRSFIGPQINDVEFSEFYRALMQRKTGMPRYFLTKQEIEALYFYLHKNEIKESTNVK